MLAESVSMAMLVVLETLSPDERAVFVLREVFGFDYDEIAAAVGKSRRRGAPGRAPGPRARAGPAASASTPSTRQRTREITAEFLAAAAGGDVRRLLSMLAPDVVWTADSGGKASAARRPIVGADKVARAVIGLMRRGAQQPDVRVETAICNSAPAVVLYLGDRFEGVFTVEIVDGQITNFYAMRNPDKLAARDGSPREITRR